MLHNLRYPYGTSVVRDAAQGVSLAYNDTWVYALLIGVHSVALILIAVFFWGQGSHVPRLGQRLRVRSIAVGFILGSTPFLINPLLSLDAQAVVGVVFWSLSIVSLAIINLVGLVVESRSERLPTTN